MANEKLRYIIADVNTKEIASHIEDGTLHKWCERWREAAYSCLSQEDAVEVIHAHWEDGYAVHNGKEVYKSIDCSHCNDIFKIESEDREYWKERFKVCPFCGAVMDGDGNE